jgi:hypothetical protein
MHAFPGVTEEQLEPKEQDGYEVIKFTTKVKGTPKYLLSVTIVMVEDFYVVDREILPSTDNTYSTEQLYDNDSDIDNEFDEPGEIADYLTSYIHTEQEFHKFVYDSENVSRFLPVVNRKTNNAKPSSEEWWSAYVNIARQDFKKRGTYERKFERR